MLQIKSYTKKNGKTYYKFQTYLGTDQTGKVVRAARQGFASKSEARKEAMRLKSEYQEDGYQKPTYETFEEVYELWFESRYLNKVKESTAVKTKELFKNHILKDFGKLRITAITFAHCQEAVNKWSKKTTKTKSMVGYCKRIFDYAIYAMDIIKKNPMNGVDVPKLKKTSKEDYAFYSREELEHFLECAKKEGNSKWFVMLRLLSFSGMRKGEALGLQWKDINFENQTVSINKTLARGEDNKLIIQTTKTTSGERTISLDDKTLEILKQWRTTQRLDYLKLGMNTNRPTQNIFTNLENNYIQHAHLTTVMDRIVKKHNLKRITVHQLRHSHCSLLFEAGANIKEVQERLGHSSYEVTLNIYTHVTKERKEETAAKFASFMGF